MRRQCGLLEIHRSGRYEEAAPESEENLEPMRLINAQYLKTSFFGSRSMTEFLRRAGHAVNRKRNLLLMRKMGLEGLAPGPEVDPDFRTSG